MRKHEYQTIRDRIEQRYRDDLAALDRIYALWNDSPEPAPYIGKMSRSEAMKASWMRRRLENADGEKPFGKKKFDAFLTNGGTK